MRASRLLLELLLLQNRGRMTSVELARELEVSTRTILRDVEALTEAGLPIVVVAGRGGGIELGFSYRTRLTGLATDEAEALGVILGRDYPELAVLGLAGAGARARTKVLESLPDGVRVAAQEGARRFPVTAAPEAAYSDDPRLPALALAIRQRALVRVRAHTSRQRTIHPAALTLTRSGWEVTDALDPDHPLGLSDCGSINISRRRYDVGVED